VPTAAEYERAGVYDPAASNAADRLALLEFLAAQGVSLDEMVAACAEHELVAAAGDRAIRPGRTMTLDEVAARSGLSADQVLDVVLAAGGSPGPDGGAPRFTEHDVETFAMFRAGTEIFGEEATLAFTRVLGAAAGRVADAAVSLFLLEIQRPLDESEAGELALAQANLQAITSLDAVDRAMAGIFRMHLEAAIRRSREARPSGQSHGSRHLAVGFVDLVGFTPLVQEMEESELGDLVERFEAQANAIVARRDGRVVKHLGDEVMFVAVDARKACDIALDLVESFEADDSPVQPHGGVAAGTVLTRGGDYYGPVVNLASRVADLAVPYEILVTEGVVEDVPAGAFALEPAGRRILKGFGAPVPLWSVTRSPTSS
jgi:adenylate cyclase